MAKHGALRSRVNLAAPFAQHSVSISWSKAAGHASLRNRGKTGVDSGVLTSRTPGRRCHGPFWRPFPNGAVQVGRDGLAVPLRHICLGAVGFSQVDRFLPQGVDDVASSRRPRHQLRPTGPASRKGLKTAVGPPVEVNARCCPVGNVAQPKPPRRPSFRVWVGPHTHCPPGPKISAVLCVSMAIRSYTPPPARRPCRNLPDEHSPAKSCRPARRQALIATPTMTCVPLGSHGRTCPEEGCEVVLAA